MNRWWVITAPGPVLGPVPISSKNVPASASTIPTAPVNTNAALSVAASYVPDLCIQVPLTKKKDPHRFIDQIVPVSPTSAVKPGYCPAVIAYGFNSFGGYGGYNDGVYGGYGANNYIAGSSLPDLSDGNVLVECLRDADCPGIRKCCGRSGYQRRCALPLSVPSYGR